MALMMTSSIPFFFSSRISSMETSKLFWVLFILEMTISGLNPAANIRSMDRLVKISSAEAIVLSRSRERINTMVLSLKSVIVC